jgi:predicted ATP-dependent endonuclease of OLD family
MTEDIFIKEIEIKKVRHITNLVIPVSKTQRKHIIFTGINGSGKTSVLLELVNALKTSHYIKSMNSKYLYNKQIGILFNYELGFPSMISPDESCFYNFPLNFVMAFFKARRDNLSKAPTGINKVDIKPYYDIEEKAGTDFIQYIVNLKADRSFAKDSNEQEEVKKIDEWFEYFEKALFTLFDKKDTRLVFDRKSYNFNIIEPGKEPYNLNQLSDGYSAILDIVTELIMRMEVHKSKSYDVQGIVLIDEVETHLHIELQKKILPFLTTFFPKIQFIVTTHSPFVISSIDNAVVCDLEKRTVISDDLSAYTSEALIEDYFDSDQYSNLLKNEVIEYEKLMTVDTLDDKQAKRLAELEERFANVPSMSEELIGKIQQIKLSNLSKKI